MGKGRALTNNEIEARLPVWEAMHCLWLDTDVDRLELPNAAKTCAASDFSLKQLEDIWWREVFWLMHTNLEQVAGDWAPYLTDYIRKAVPAHPKFGTPPRLRGIHPYGAPMWDKLEAAIIALRGGSAG